MAYKIRYRRGRRINTIVVKSQSERKLYSDTIKSVGHRIISNRKIKGD